MWLSTWPQRSRILGAHDALLIADACALNPASSWSYSRTRVVRYGAAAIAGGVLAFPVGELRERLRADRAIERSLLPGRLLALRRARPRYPDLDPAAWLLEALVVDGNWRRRGIGAALVVDVLGRAAPAPVQLLVDEHNAAALRLYEGLGFAVHGCTAARLILHYSP